MRRQLQYWTCLWGLFHLVSIGCGSTSSRNPAPAAPQPQTVALSSEALDDIQKTVRTGLRSINNCFAEEMDRSNNPQLRIKLLLKIHIGTDLAADTVTLENKSNTSPAFDACVIQEVKRWEFPQIASPTWFTYPLELTPAY